jgi:hypothetical protein
MNSRLQAARADTKQLIQKTASLQQESHSLNVQQEVLTLFLGRFVLREDEKKALLPSSKELSEEFFSAFARAKQIHEDCKILLRTSQQRAGLSIMEAMAALQEMAYERLYRWTQSMLHEPLLFISPTLYSLHVSRLHVLCSLRWLTVQARAGH